MSPSFVLPAEKQHCRHLCSNSPAAEGCSNCVKPRLLKLLQVDIMHNAQRSAAHMSKLLILRSCILLTCLVGCAHSSAASDGKSNCFSCAFNTWYNSRQRFVVCCKSTDNYSWPLQLLRCCNSAETSPTLLQSAAPTPFRGGRLLLLHALAGLAFCVTALAESPACMLCSFCLTGYAGRASKHTLRLLCSSSTDVPLSFSSIAHTCSSTRSATLYMLLAY